MTRIVNDICTWMSELPDNRILYDICMPASHDAGLYEVSSMKIISDESKVITQDSNITDQLKYGVRFFDLRIFKNGNNEYRAGHFAEVLGGGKADGGGFGPTVDAIFDQVMNYMGDYGGGEVVFLRLSHTKDSVANEVIQKVNHYFSDFLYKTVTDNVDMSCARLSDVRGKVIPICDPENFGNHINPRNGIFGFGKSFGDGVQLITKGKYANKKDYGDMYEDQAQKLQAMWEERTTSKNFFMQLYWTLTGGDIHDNTTSNLFYNTRHELPAMLDQYKPNVVLYDFCNANHSEVIVKNGNTPN